MVSMLNASWSNTENIQQPCGVALQFHLPNHAAILWRQNLIKISVKLFSKLGPTSIQSLREIPLYPFAEASKTGRTFVETVDSRTTGLWGK